ncbi:MAG: hypothetical protein J0H19_15585 [Rhodospirillales bacterium]|mgnify:CR=1 FL=1|nr:hypothetical protein [Rhodospirillales bacterium]MBN8928032.1 hypothetical protein [Rhodospirillales bacterium]
MTDFSTLKRRVMDTYRSTVLPMVSDGRPGHIWTGRLEMAGLIEQIDAWMDRNGMDIEAVALRDEFKAMPHAKYSVAECIEALKAETKRWTG